MARIEISTADTRYGSDLSVTVLVLDSSGTPTTPDFEPYVNILRPDGTVLKQTTAQQFGAFNGAYVYRLTETIGEDYERGSKYDIYVYTEISSTGVAGITAFTIPFDRKIDYIYNKEVTRGYEKENQITGEEKIYKEKEQ